ncbi:MAG TPA: isoprenylcysteine carboxylmethyltransferase family protein [Longimicrobiaceae bacterium]|nr:isoprenylcysteine carboxylmethyltransferase family protein [Longimicrobiaceae bacterium]
MLLLKNLLFTVLVPGTAAGLLPYLILTRGAAAVPLAWGAAQWLALALGVVGAAVYAWCTWDFASLGRGTPAPIDPPRTLVVRGPYRYVRNPMYWGVLLVLAGEVVFFSSGALLRYVLVWCAVVHLFVVLYEEPALSRRFDGSYERYRGAVRRWIPGRPYTPPAAARTRDT